MTKKTILLYRWDEEYHVFLGEEHDYPPYAEEDVFIYLASAHKPGEPEYEALSDDTESPKEWLYKSSNGWIIEMTTRQANEVVKLLNDGNSTFEKPVVVFKKSDKLIEVEKTLYKNGIKMPYNVEYEYNY